jgi:large subunit ribosomal protein L13
METPDNPITVVNAEGLILGRMASYVAKRALKGEEIVVVNAEKAILSGKKSHKVKEAKIFLEVGHLRWGPAHFRRPDRIVRRTIKGMLPTEKTKGKQAYKRVRVYIGLPNELKNRKMESIEQARAKKLKSSFFTVGELAKEIGWNAGA